jgi:2-oxoglutarate dehydrogenase E1 component
VRRYEDALAKAKRKVAEEPAQAQPRVEEMDGSAIVPTGVSPDVIKGIAHKLPSFPKVSTSIRRWWANWRGARKWATAPVPVDWAFAESIAFGSMVLEGTRVRLSGQDSGRGTFSQRHAVLYDTQNGKAWAPLAELRSESNPEARFDVYDSSLSEEGVLGFEYGYSVGRAERSRRVGSAVWRLRQRRADDHRSVHRRFRKTSGNRNHAS